MTHRDLKPEVSSATRSEKEGLLLIEQNILLTKETPESPRQIKIADFGLAKMGVYSFYDQPRSSDHILTLLSTQRDHACIHGRDAAVPRSGGSDADKTKTGLREQSRLLVGRHRCLQHVDKGASFRRGRSSTCRCESLGTMKHFPVTDMSETHKSEVPSRGGYGSFEAAAR